MSRRLAAAIVICVSLLGVVAAERRFVRQPAATPGGAHDDTSAAVHPLSAMESQLALVKSNGYESAGAWFVEGQVTNIAGVPLDQIQVVVQWFDGNGDFVKSDTAFIDFHPLLPGQTSHFKATSEGSPSMMKYTVQFKRHRGGMFSTRDDRR